MSYIVHSERKESLYVALWVSSDNTTNLDTFPKFRSHIEILLKDKWEYFHLCMQNWLCYHWAHMFVFYIHVLSWTLCFVCLLLPYGEVLFRITYYRLFEVVKTLIYILNFQKKKIWTFPRIFPDALKLVSKHPKKLSSSSCIICFCFVVLWYVHRCAGSKMVLGQEIFVSKLGVPVFQ